MFTGDYTKDWKEIADQCKSEADWKCIRCNADHNPGIGYCLTVHHFNGDKGLNEWWNLLALCQRCHLSFQSRVNPEVPYMFEHSDWLKPYVAGFYAWKYQDRLICRNEAKREQENLLKLERLA